MGNYARYNVILVSHNENDPGPPTKMTARDADRIYEKILKCW